MLKTKKTTVQDLNELQGHAIEQIKNYQHDPKEVQKYLDFMSQFYNYSYRNALLIAAQWEGAAAVDSYVGWKKRGFPVKRGEKSQIKILAPSTVTKFYGLDGSQKTLKRATKKEKALINAGQIDTRKKTFFRLGSVFEMSQTEATPEDYPKLYPNRHVNFNVDPEAYKTIMAGLDKCLVDKGIGFRMAAGSAEIGSAKGLYSYSSDNLKGQEIVLNPENTRGENLAVLIHELGHAYLHRGSDLSRPRKELQAEFTSYLVSQYYGIDTENEAVSYINNWCGHLEQIEKKELDKLLKDVQNVSKSIIDTIEGGQDDE